MEINAIAGASQLMKSASTQQSLSVSMIKKNSELQEQMANMIAQNSKNAPATGKNPDYGFQPTPD